MEDFLTLLMTLGLTLIIEYPIAQLIWLLIRKDEKQTIFTFFNNKLIIIPVIIVNVLTNPALNIYARYLFRETNMPEEQIWQIITVLELVIWVFEGVLYKFMLNTKWSKALLLAITANLVSYMSSFLL